MRNCTIFIDLLALNAILSGLHTEAVSFNVTVASVVMTTLGCSNQKKCGLAVTERMRFSWFFRHNVEINNVMTEGKRTDFELC